MKPTLKEDLLQHLITVLPEQTREEKITLLNTLCPQSDMELRGDALYMKGDNDEQHVLLSDIARVFICRNCGYIQMKDLTQFLLEINLQTGKTEVVCTFIEPTTLQKILLKLKKKFENLWK